MAPVSDGILFRKSVIYFTKEKLSMKHGIIPKVLESHNWHVLWEKELSSLVSEYLQNFTRRCSFCILPLLTREPNER